MKMTRSGSTVPYIVFCFAIILFILIVPKRILPNTQSSHAKEKSASVNQGIDRVLSSSTSQALVGQDEVSHVTLPSSVKALYMSSWVAGTKKIRDPIIKTIEETEVNAVVIDIKDYTGMISFLPDGKSESSKSVLATGCIEERIKDLPELIQELHDKNIYVIGRVAVFQDPCLVKKSPDIAVKTKSSGGVWKDHKGITWIDAGAKDAWKYNVDIAKSAYEMGFDEINFDYIRFPSDGNMIDIKFPESEGRIKSDVLKDFFSYIDKELRGGKAIGVLLNDRVNQDKSATSTSRIASTTAPVSGRYTQASDPAFDDLVKNFNLNIPIDIAKVANIQVDGKKQILKYSDLYNDHRPIISADLFGFVTTNNDDLGIGQILEKVAPYVDFIGPMVYPSHYPKNFMGYTNPANYPYEVIQYTMSQGGEKLINIGLNPLKLRPWLQDFNMGAVYDASKVRSQIDATYDVGLTGWMMWDASNTYTRGGLLSI